MPSIIPSRRAAVQARSESRLNADWVRSETSYNVLRSVRFDCKKMLIVRKLGNSIGLTFPAMMVREYGLAPGAKFDVEPMADGAMVLRPTRAKLRFTAAELNARCNPRAPMPADLVDWDAMPTVGSEAL